jgi:FkbM family methyltransferase
MTTVNILQKVLNLIPIGLRNRIKNTPGLKQLQAELMKTYLYGKEFDAKINAGPAKGLMFPVKLPQDKQMWIGTWEMEFATALQQYVKPGWTCYDIGGYKGYYAGVMALKGAVNVFVFEPMPANAEKIDKLINLNPSLPIHLQKLAVSDYTGKAVFKLMTEETMGKLEASSFQKDEKEVTQLTVNCVTLDDLTKNNLPEPDFIKIDVEGAEEFVLKGGIQLLEKKKPLLMIEVHSPEIGKRCLQILSGIYTNITVLETGLSPDKGTPEICHYIAVN